MQVLDKDESFSSVAFDTLGNAIVGSSGGVWHSSKPGIEGSWSNTLTTADISSVAFDNKGHAIAGGDKGVWYSSNAGLSWTKQLTISEQIFSVAFDTVGNAIAGGGNYAGTLGGIWYSSNAGLSWTKQLTTEFFIKSVAFDNKGNAIAGGGNFVDDVGGIWYSSNAGLSWTKQLTTEVVIKSVAFDNKGNAIAGGGNGDSGGIWYSSNAGLSWTKQLTIPGIITSVAFNNKGNALAGSQIRDSGVWYSSDAGVNWIKQLNTAPDYIVSVALDNLGNAVAGEFSAGGTVGLWYSSDFGVSWTRQFLNVVGINAIAFDNKGNAIAVSGDKHDPLLNAGIWYSSAPTPAPTPTPTPTPTPIPTSNICFPAGTPIKTDQGILLIDSLQPAKHTLQGLPILHITKTVTLDKYLIAFSPHSIGRHMPTARTIMTKDHQIEFEGRLVPAERFLDYSSEIKKVKYTGEILYNVLLPKHSRMNVNGITCETLHPENIMAKLYTKAYSEEERNTIILHLNDSLHAKNIVQYKKVVDHLTA